MRKKRWCLTITLIFAFCFAVSSILAEENQDELRSKLRDLGYQKEKLTREYQNQVDKISRASGDKLAEIKEEFHRKRDACLNDKKDKLNAAKKDYETRIEPLAEKEKEIIQKLAPEGGSNFAKSKSEKKK
ncbi:MAG: hypothetical protein PHP46_00935 [Candidatus Omnitrophica bacterium]|nr:hypothetical protein [Candidatus Omnitrophota bacterium]